MILHSSFFTAGISPPKLPKEVEDRLVDITNEIHDNQNEIDDFKQQLEAEKQNNSPSAKVQTTTNAMMNKKTQLPRSIKQKQT